MAEQPINVVRRKDREVTDEAWIRNFLRAGQHAVVASESDGQPFAHPVTYVYDEAANAICFHTSRKGRIFANLTRNPRVCLNVSRMGRLLTASTAAGFGVAYESVTVFGRAEVIADTAEAEHALRLLLEKYFAELEYGVDYTPASAEEIANTAVYRVMIESWSAKRQE